MAFDRIIVGLGNPGRRYRGTRHNIGTDLVEKMAARHGIDMRRTRHDSLIGDGLIEGARSFLALPQTYMNLSGQAVRKILAFTGSPPSSLLVVHDDLDLPLGRIRLRRGGGAGGHKGIGSIVQHLHSPDFLRLKIGIGRPPAGQPSDKYVLESFAPVERQAVEESLERGVAAVEALFLEGLDKAMSIFNRAD